MKQSRNSAATQGPFTIGGRQRVITGPCEHNHIFEIIPALPGSPSAARGEPEQGPVALKVQAMAANVAVHWASAGTADAGRAMIFMLKSSFGVALSPRLFLLSAAAQRGMDHRNRVSRYNKSQQKKVLTIPEKRV